MSNHIGEACSEYSKRAWMADEVKKNSYIRFYYQLKNKLIDLEDDKRASALIVGELFSEYVIGIQKVELEYVTELNHALADLDRVRAGHIGVARQEISATFKQAVATALEISVK